MRFSIIIPAHNAERRLPRLLESIRKQTFTDYEIVIVCDACTDETDEVGTLYGARMFSVDAHNSATARNKGLDEARGEWIIFADDDDFFMQDYALEHIDRELTAAGDRVADMIQCAFVFGSKGVMPANGKIWPNVWSKVFKRTAIGDTRFPEDRFPADDLGFVELMLQKRATVAFAPMLWYYYDWMRPGSITAGLENA